MTGAFNSLVTAGATGTIKLFHASEVASEAERYGLITPMEPAMSAARPSNSYGVFRKKRQIFWDTCCCR
jgi:hypothetical protein